MKKMASGRAIEIEALLAEGKLERIGMGSRRACYRLPDGKHCLKCYRSDDEIAEGKYPGEARNKPLADAVIREIRRYRFDEKRNTCAQEYRYRLALKKRLPESLMAAYPSTMEFVELPTRGLAEIEELVVNADGTPLRKIAEEWHDASEEKRVALFAAFDTLAASLASHAVRMYDPQTIFVQNSSDGSFRLRITDFEPGSRMLVRIDAIPAITRMKVKRRFARFLRQNGIRLAEKAD